MNESEAHIKNATERSADRISRKDRLSLTISIVALLLSSTTLVLNRLDAHRASNIKQDKASYNAYQLGKRFATSFVIYTQTREGDPASVKTTKEEALDHARRAQAYANSLDLKFEIADLISKHRLGNSLIGEGVTETIETRLRAEYGQQVTNKFSLGFWLVWLHVNVQAVAEVHPEYKPTFIKDYRKVASIINGHLAEMGIKRTIAVDMPDVESSKKSTIEIKDLVEATLDAGQR